MGLQEFRKAYPGELSVSAEQRIIIGRSFAMQPDLLLMDEPYGQMDVKMRFIWRMRLYVCGRNWGAQWYSSPTT